MHAWSITIVAFATNLSALWILLANGWMQNPVGAKITQIANNPLLNQRAEMVDFMAVLTNPSGWLKFFHTTFSGYVVAAFFVMGISAWHILRNNELRFFKLSFQKAAIFGLGACLLIILTGDFHGRNIARTQPTKLAAIEAIWETQQGAGMSLVVIPDETNRKNSVEWLTIPKLASLLSYGDPNAEIKGLNDFKQDELPPVSATFYSFRAMSVLGFAMFLIAAVAVYVSKKENLEDYTGFLKIAVWSIPLPYLAGQLGWIVAEVGRQPWIVYGMLKTKDAVSTSIDVTQVLISLIAFTLLYGSLGVVDIYLLAKYSKQGPTDRLVKKEA
jgi:cytochrome d ubiquinol oxidase subunit I